MKIYQQLLNLIRTSKLSVIQIGREARVPYRTIENWLYAGVKPPMDKAEKVLNALGYELVIKKRG